MSPADRPPPGRRGARGDRAELITSTGIRFTGSAVELVADLPSAHATVSLRPEDIFFAASFLVRPRSGRADSVDLLLSVLNSALGGVREGDDPLGREGSLAESSGRYHALQWETFALEDRWAGELTWVHPHPVIRGLPCTTHVAISETGRSVDLAVHVGASEGLAAVRGFVGAGQARPAFLAEMNRVVQLGFDRGGPEVRELDESVMPSFVKHELLSESRRHPVAVLAPVEPSDSSQDPAYLVPPALVAEELLGLAHLYVIDRHRTTFVLTDVLRDKRLSCFRGALRVYMPGFSLADNPMEHPLLVQDRVEDPVERAGVLGRLGREARDRIPLRHPVAELREAALPPPALPPRAAAEAEPPVPEETPAAVGESAPAAPLPAQAQAAAVPEGGAIPASFERLARAITDRLDELVRLQAELIDEVARLRTVTAVRTANAAGVERRLGQFERLLREHLRGIGDVGTHADGAALLESVPRVEDEQADVTLTAVVQHAETEYADALLVLDSAIASAEESPYEDVHRVAANLKAMAELARRRQEGRLGMSLRDAFAEAGMDYRGGIAPSTSKRQRQQYVADLPGGETVECHEHLVLGTSYDPRHCLRIYFTSRAPGEPRFVIAHVGRHFDVITTT